MIFGDNEVDLITKVEMWAVRILSLLTFLGILIAAFIREWRQMGLIWIVATLSFLLFTAGGLMVWLAPRRARPSPSPDRAAISERPGTAE